MQTDEAEETVWDSAKERQLCGKTKTRVILESTPHTKFVNWWFKGLNGFSTPKLSEVKISYFWIEMMCDIALGHLGQRGLKHP